MDGRAEEPFMSDTLNIENVGKEYEKYSRHFGQWLSDLYAQTVQWAGSLDTYIQAGVLGVCVLIAYTMGWLLRWKFPLFHRAREQFREGSGKWFMARAGRLFSPVLLLVLLSLSVPIADESLKSDPILLEAAARVAWIWLLWVALKAFITHPLVRNIALWLLIPAAILRFFGLLAPTISYLDGIGFTFGEVRISIYIFLKGMLVASFLLWLGRLASTGAERYIRRSKAMTISTRELLIKLFDITLYAVLFLILLNMVGIDLTALAVFSGALGVGLGFGLQKIASNFISGIILLSERSITIGNLLELDNGTCGIMKKLGARASIVETADGKEVMIPNEDFITSRVANLTHSNTRGRIEFSVGVSYESDLEQVKAILDESARAHPECLSEPEPTIFLREFADNSVNFLITFWVGDVEKSGKWGPQSDVMFTIWNRFKEAGIEIPFPQRDIHIRSGLEALRPTPEKAEQKRAAGSDT